jgi:hypothetical protein
LDGGSSQEEAGDEQVGTNPSIQPAATITGKGNSPSLFSNFQPRKPLP